MKQLVTLLFILSIVILSGCTTTDNIVKEKITLTSESSLEDFYGKPSIILFAETSCEHCQQTVPVFKKKVYDAYLGDINVWINVLDNGKFNVKDIPQGLNPNLNFNAITKTECKYVPSWVILDKNGNVALSSCGKEKEMSDMIQTIKELI